MNKPLILVVEDDQPVRNLDRHHAQGARLPLSGGRHRAKRRSWRPSSHNPDIILLDLGLPDMDGVEVITQASAPGPTLPIIVISARSEDTRQDQRPGRRRGRLSDQALFGGGAAGPPARDAAQAGGHGRGGGARRTPAFVNGDLRIDYAAGCAYLRGEELHLTPIEYKLLCLLAQNVGKVLTHTYITRKIWGNGMGKRYRVPARVHGHPAQKAGKGRAARSSSRRTSGWDTGCCAWRRTRKGYKKAAKKPFANCNGFFSSTIG